MPRGRKVKGTEVEGLIIGFYKRHPKWTAKVVHKKVKELLHKDDPSLPANWPTLGAVQKVLAKARVTEDPEDKPWSILTLADYEIEAEALPMVIELWAYALREYKNPLTIREMKWAARIYKLKENDLVGLLLLSTQYAAYERASQILGDKVATIAENIGFRASTELYVDIHEPKLTAEELLHENPEEILKRKRQNLLSELRSPEILEVLKTKRKQRKQKGGKSK